MYKYKYIALYLGLLLTLITGCEKIAGDGNLPEDLEDALENTGVSVEVIEIHSLDLIEGENAKVTIYSKILDYKGGNNIEKVELYLYSFNLKNGVESQTLKEDPVKLLDLPLDSLEVFEDGLSGVFNLELTDLLEKLPVKVPINELRPEDSFIIQWHVSLKTGTKITETCERDNKGDLRNLCYDIRLVKTLPNDMFSGEYRFTQLDSSSLSDNYTGWVEIFEDMQFEAALSVVNNTTREFKAEYLGNAWSELGVEERISSIPIMFDIKGNPTENAVTVSYEISSGLGCDDGPLKIGPEKENVSYFDEEDDSEFIFVVTDNTEGVCDSKPKQVQFLVEKL